MKKYLFILTIATMLLNACSRGMVYDHFDHTPLAGWEKLDTLSFDVPAVADSGQYSTTLGMRINNTFPFMTLSLIVEQKVIPAGKTYIDTLTCQLIDKDGKILGRGVNNYQYRFPVSVISLHQKDSLHITIHHNMRREIMPGISDIGIQLEKLE